MTRNELEHIIQAAGTIANAADIVVIGGQAILGQFPNAPPELLISNAVDLVLPDDPDHTDVIDGTLGQGSLFQRAFGYSAHVVAEPAAVLPEGWHERLVLLTGGHARFVRGWCLEVHDLAIAKYLAGREEDLDFTRVLVRHSMVGREVLQQRLEATQIDPQIRALAQARIQADFDVLP